MNDVAQSNPPSHEDQPTRLEPGLPPEVASPLAPFEGREPPRPEWFERVLRREPERTFVPVTGANIELLTWGEVGKPGLIFVHGNSAHADWWSFIAPFFTRTHRVASMSLSGMGGSDWRERYSFPLYAEEIHACAEAAGLYKAAEKPIYVGHSFGGALVYFCAAQHPEWMRAALLVDTGFGGPPTPEERERMDAEDRAAGRPPRTWGAPRVGATNRVYPTFEKALTRFRFMPPQVPGNLYIADYIARRSLKPAPMPDGSGEGWTWRFDPEIWAKLDREGMTRPPAANGRTPLAHIFGDRSAIIHNHRQMGRGIDTVLPKSAPRVVLPDSEHHVMVDQPLALVSAIRAMLETWP